MSISLSPIGKEEIKNLETALLVETLFRKEVLEEIKKPSERLTWLTSLGIAAGALAREKAKLAIKQIAEELGVTEATVRSHLTGRTKAGQLVKETYEKFLKEGVAFKGFDRMIQVEEIKKALSELSASIEAASKKIEEIKKMLE
ncbi:MAG: transcriptional regulator [Candidatus Methanodesulfokora sp.]|jgi:probable regulatory domain-containing protein